VVYYRASRDIHSQEHPQAFSLSINLLVGQAASPQKDQYFFDLEAGAVSDVAVGGGAASRLLPCRLARLQRESQFFYANRLISLRGRRYGAAAASAEAEGRAQPLILTRRYPVNSRRD